MKIYLHGLEPWLGALKTNKKSPKELNYMNISFVLYKFFNTLNFEESSYENCDICVTGDFIPNAPNWRKDILHIHLTGENLYKFNYHIKKRTERQKCFNNIFIGTVQNDTPNFIYLPEWALWHNERFNLNDIPKQNNFEDRFNNGVCSMFRIEYPHREYIINNYKSKKVKGSDKRDILKDYLFNIAAENTKDPFGYYITEKLPDAIFANCIPIYWGGNLNNTPFNQDRIINITDLSNLPNITKYSKTQLEDIWNLNPFNCDFEDYCESLIENAVNKIKERL